jgi:hypothetical protein
MTMPAQPLPVFNESIGDALIDSARISVMAAMQARPAHERPLIVMPGDDDSPTVSDCLAQAMQWLDAARSLATEPSAAPPTSIHVVTSNAHGGTT